MIQYESVIDAFNKFIKKYDFEEAGIKISHSYHVANLARILAKKMSLSEEEVEFARVLGLIHDIGRFSQYEEYGEYSDMKTKLDHAEVAIHYLFNENHIEDFKIPEKYHKFLKVAIKNHNKYKIENGLEEKELFWSKFIRDVDKIDILRAESADLELKYEEPATKEVLNSFNKQILVDRKSIKSKSDDIIGVLAFLFDIEFKESFELLHESDNLELFLGSIEVQKGLDKEFEDLKNRVRNYLEERLKDNE